MKSVGKESVSDAPLVVGLYTLFNQKESFFGFASLSHLLADWKERQDDIIFQWRPYTNESRQLRLI